MPSKPHYKTRGSQFKRPPRTLPADLPPQPLDDYPPRLPTETPTAYLRFCQYCDQAHPRAAKRVGVSESVRRWPSIHAWAERAAQFDAARRKHRLARLAEAQLERDLLTLEADGRLADLARGLLFGEGEPADDAPPDTPQPLLHALTQIARAGQNDHARLTAIDKLVEYSGIGDLRRLRAKQLAIPFEAPPATAPAPPVLAEVVDALVNRATPEQLDALCDAPLVDDLGPASD